MKELVVTDTQRLRLVQQLKEKIQNETDRFEKHSFLDMSNQLPYALSGTASALEWVRFTILQLSVVYSLRDYIKRPYPFMSIQYSDKEHTTYVISDEDLRIMVNSRFNVLDRVLLHVISSDDKLLPYVLNDDFFSHGFINYYDRVDVANHSTDDLK